jgi:hypothetical protein
MTGGSPVLSCTSTHMLEKRRLCLSFYKQFENKARLAIYTARNLTWFRDLGSFCAV